MKIEPKRASDIVRQYARLYKINGQFGAGSPTTWRCSKCGDFVPYLYNVSMILEKIAEEIERDNNCSGEG